MLIQHPYNRSLCIFTTSQVYSTPCLSQFILILLFVTFSVCIPFADRLTLVRTLTLVLDYVFVWFAKLKIPVCKEAAKSFALEAELFSRLQFWTVFINHLTNQNGIFNDT